MLATSFPVLFTHFLLACFYLFPTTLTAQVVGGSLPYEPIILKNMADGAAQMAARDYGTALSSFLSVYEHVKTLPDTSRIAWVYYKHLSNLMSSLDATDLAIDFGKKSYALSKKLHPPPANVMYQRAGTIGSKYIELNQFDSASVYLGEALGIAKGLKNPLFLAAAFNNIGIMHEKWGKPDALQYYQTALVSAPMDTILQDALFASIQDNLAGWYLKSGNYTAALQCCQQIYKWLEHKKGHEPRRLAKTLLKEAQCLNGLGEHEKAIDKLLDNKTLFTSPPLLDLQLEYFQQLARLLKKAGRYEEMGEAMASAQPIADTLSARQIRLGKLAIDGVTQVRTSAIRRDLENLSLKSKQQELILKEEQQKARYSRLVLLFVVFAGSALVIVGFLFYSRKIALQNKKLELETIQNELTAAKLRNEYLEKERLALTLERKEKDLSGLIIYISQAREWQNGLLESMESIETKVSKDALSTLRKIIADLRSRLLVDERLKIFQDNIEVLDRQFFAKLREKHPRLSAEDLQLCGCFRLNMSAKDIASMRGISLKSINMSRYRLRKKLGLQPEDDLNIYLQSL